MTARRPYSIRLSDEERDALELARGSESFGGYVRRRALGLDPEGTTPEELSAAAARAWRREIEAGALRRAHAAALGCHDYNGGLFGEEGRAFHDGIGTVANVLEAIIDGDTSHQVRVVEAIGAAALRSRD